MAKRFCETTRWADPFFRKLSPGAKLAFIYLCDNCDSAGVWESDYQLANFSIKLDLDWDEILEELGNRVKKLRSGKIWLTRFIEFQCGRELKPDCAPHNQVRKLLEKHGIPLREVYRDRGDEPASEEKTPEPEPELPGLRKPRESRARDLLFEALAAVDGADISRLTSGERGRLNKAAAEIRKVEPATTPERVALAVKAWKRKGWSAGPTSTGIASRWSELTPAPETSAGIEAKAVLRAELRAAKAELEPLMDSSRTVPFPREDLTEDQLSRCRDLKDLIADLSRQIG